MLARVVALASLLLGAGHESAAPVLVLRSGEASLAEDRRVRHLEVGPTGAELQGQAGWVESGALSEVRLAWRGCASASIHGPASFTLERSPALALESFQDAEVEVRRGPLRLTLGGFGALELGSGALQLRALPGGLEVVNRGGESLELRRRDAAVRIAPGQRVRLRREPE